MEKTAGSIFLEGIVLQVKLNTEHINNLIMPPILQYCSNPDQAAFSEIDAKPERD